MMFKTEQLAWTKHEIIYQDVYSVSAKSN